jgi:1-acyl-sn-glycerol-3-phosphate acyltransferase
MHNIDRKKKYVIIANHQSLLDILVVAATLPLNFKFLAKRELFYVPIMGWAMALAGYIPLNRSSHESGKMAVLKISKYLKKGASVLLFPEGTRSRDGRIHAFKMGAFKLSRETGCAILPVVIEGTGQALPKNSFFIRKKSTFTISIGKPVDLSDLGDESMEDAKERVRHEMTGRLEKIRHQRSHKVSGG